MNVEVRISHKIVISKRPLVRPRRRRKDNAEVDVKEIGRKSVDRIHLPQVKVLWRDAPS